MIFFILFFFIQGLLTLCICQYIFLLSLLFIYSELKLPIDSVQILALYILAGELSASNSSHPCRYKEANVFLAPMNLGTGTVENSEMKTENLSFFLWKNWIHQGIGRCLIEAQNPVKKKGIQAAANSVLHSKTGHKFSDCLSQCPPQMLQKRLRQSQLQNHQDLELPGERKQKTAQATLQKDIAFKAPYVAETWAVQVTNREHLPWACFWRKRQRKRKNQWLKSLMWLTIG